MSGPDAASLVGVILAGYYGTFATLRGCSGYDEATCAHALAAELTRRGLAVRYEVSPSYAGNHSPCLIVDEVVVVQVRRVRSLTEQHTARLRACLSSGGWRVGVLVNFGAHQPQQQRVAAG